MGPVMYVCATLSLLWTCTASPARKSYHVGLFCSTGAYSHDIMMRRLAEQLAASGHLVTLLQIRVFSFNYSIPPIESERVTIVQMNCSNSWTRDLMGQLQNQIWYSTVPFGNRRLSYRSIRLFSQLYDAHMFGCRAALQDKTFVRRVLNLNLDLIVIDYILNECALAFAALSNTPRMYLSNYPMMESYFDSTGATSNPAYVPSVLSKETIPMRFSSRVSNSICRLLALVWRQKLMHSISKLIYSFGYNSLDLRDEEMKTLLFATPSEFLLDASRPLTHNIKYLGCCKCLSQESKTFNKVRLESKWI
ncbi:unnamed protein product [Soboliphyme baturini]|uniref:glucuronosyltransferase n=1 Tax=Soboliphyme baturini TaxID=241478 RepID=A0A183IN83_9BILA|nr:unnamed protein product [Soboliphyme baturini]